VKSRKSKAKELRGQVAAPPQPDHLTTQRFSVIGFLVHLFGLILRSLLRLCLILSFSQAKRACLSGRQACLPAGRSGIGIPEKQTADSGQAGMTVREFLNLSLGFSILTYKDDGTLRFPPLSLIYPPFKVK